ncbi:transposase [Frankia sp. Ag45/Mut15]|uniref:Transposase n=1 Tax=Frankia umida TaxID=573489 RepID=A0ABT0K2Q7_9ACTN|nr:transposase [Frankia umida]MCK9878114.1 transposase [Frankia umida]
MGGLPGLPAGVEVELVERAAGVSWHTAHRGFVAVAEEAGIVVTAPAAGTGPDGPVADQETTADGEAGRPVRSVSGPLPGVEVLGIDDHRRGRPRYQRDPLSGGWVADADRWQTGLFDSAGGHGLLGAVEGSTAAATVGWIEARPAAWRAGIRAVTIDMSTVYKAAARDALPHAMIAVDPFHVAQLANKAVGDVRRRVTHQLRDRRGRATDPEYTIRNLLVRGPGALSGNGRAKNHLLDLLALSPTRTGRATTRTDVDRALTRFFDYCATTGATVPEIVALAETISDWRVEITAAVLHGLSNAAAEGANRLIKLVYRTAFGLTNVANQQRRQPATARPHRPPPPAPRPHPRAAPVRPGLSRGATGMRRPRGAGHGHLRVPLAGRGRDTVTFPQGTLRSRTRPTPRHRRPPHGSPPPHRHRNQLQQSRMDHRPRQPVSAKFLPCTGFTVNTGKVFYRTEI